MSKSRHSAPPPLTAAFDRGPAKYFHGRKEILSNFNELIERAVRAKSGTIFLIQGAPGAGKSALMYECERRAKDSGWKVVRMPARAFWDPDKLRRTFGLGKVPQITGGETAISAGPFAKGGIAFGKASPEIVDVLQSVKAPLLLKLDEAQTLGTTNAPPPDQAGTVTEVLNAIHNGELDRPVILIAAGLGTTAKVFESLGISRFSGKCFVELGALSKESERAVIHDWLKKDGGARGDPEEWMHAIAQETHGWPHHILSYVEPATRHLRDYDGMMNADGLNTVLEAGRRFRSDYYERRVDDFHGDQIQCLAKSIANRPSGYPVLRRDIMSSLTKEYGASEAEQLFQCFLEKGILGKRGVGYAIPIPSMHNWLENEYAHIQEMEMPSTAIGKSREQDSPAISTKENP